MTGVRLTAFAWAVILACAIGACTHAPPQLADGAVDFHHLSRQARLEEIRRARVWEPTAVAAMDLRAGPPRNHDEATGFAPGALVECDYRNKPSGGNTPKFWCALPSGDEVKVKYGADNGEVYAEVAATRLFWALGFSVDKMYPVRVMCHGCSAAPHPGESRAHSDSLFDPAALELKFDGTALETGPDSGWAWGELDLVDESVGGAPLPQRDALKLLAVLVQHTDNKAAQQRLACWHHGRDEESGLCAEPVMMVNDLGMTFGRANLLNRQAVGSVNYEEWAKTPVWTDGTGCVGNLAVSQTGSLDHPRISEAGRRFLADLLDQLSDRQIHDLFEVARFADRKGPKAASTDQWVEAFKKKRTEIAGRTCPA